MVMTKAVMVFTMDDTDTWYAEQSPEHALLTAVLERAIRDLESNRTVHYLDRQAAIRWFENEDPDDVLTFKYISNELKLSSNFIAIIKRRVKISRSYEDFRRLILRCRSWRDRCLELADK